jgi:hypothetical protein
MKKKIFAVLLVMGVILSLVMFSSCNGDADPVEEEEEITITVHVKITADGGNVLAEEDVVLTGFPSQLTAFDATLKALDQADVDHTEEDGFFNSIGGIDNVVYGQAYGSDDDDEEEGAESAASEEEGEGIFWMLKINNSEEVSGSSRLSDGDVIEWNYIHIMSW